MEDALIGLIRQAHLHHSGTDEAHVFGVAATSVRRRGTIRAVLQAATDIIAEEGVIALTFRKLAGRCDMKVGNLQYYFASSRDLFQGVMRFILAEYLEALLDGPFMQAEGPEERLRRFIGMQLADVGTKRTCALFLALWDLGQRDAFVASQLEEIYAVERLLLQAMLAEIHRSAAEADLRGKASVIAALLEGLMPLFGPSSAGQLGEIHEAALGAACQIAGIAPPRPPEQN